MKKLAIVFIGFFLMAFSFNAQAQSTASVASSATITQALTITGGDPLAFGNISATATDGTVTVSSATGNATGSGGAGAVAGLTTSAATFTIEGPANETINVSVENTTFDVEHTDGDVMTVTLTESDVEDAEAVDSTEDGSVEIKFGGTVQVAGGQKVGGYSNDAAFEVTVNYN